MPKICNYLNTERIHFLYDVRNLFLGKDVEQRTGIWEKEKPETMKWMSNLILRNTLRFNHDKNHTSPTGPYPPYKLHGQDTNRGQCSCLQTHWYGHGNYLCSALLCYVCQGWNPAWCSPSSLQTWLGQCPPCPLHPTHRSLNSDSLMQSVSMIVFHQMIFRPIQWIWEEKKEVSLL